MERFVPYHIDVTRLAKAKVRMRKGDGQSYVLESDDGALEVDVADLLRALPRSEKTAPGAWTTEDADFVLDGEHYAVDTTTPVGATLLAMARFADHKTQQPSDVHHLPSEYDRFYFAEATRMPESSRCHHVFFDFFGRKLQLFDCKESDDSTAFLLPAGEWRAVDRDRFENQLDRALRLKPKNPVTQVDAGRASREPSAEFAGLTIDHWLQDWLPGSLAAYQAFLRAEPVYANTFAIELVTDARRTFSLEETKAGSKFNASERHALLTLMCLPPELAAWVRAAQSGSARAHEQHALRHQLLSVQILLREQTLLLIIMLVVFTLGGAVGIWSLHK